MKKQLVLFSASLATIPTVATNRPNIVLFMVDDMGWQDTSVPFWTERTPLNDRYALINDTIEPDLQKRQQLVAEQQLFVDSLLLNENALELAFEGFRFFDLARHDRIYAVHDSMNAKDSYWQQRKPLTETRLFLPVPTTALDANPSMSQNAGY